MAVLDSAQRPLYFRRGAVTIRGYWEDDISLGSATVSRAIKNELVGVKRRWRQPIQRPIPLTAFEVVYVGSTKLYLEFPPGGPRWSWNAVDTCLKLAAANAQNMLIDTRPWDIGMYTFTLPRPVRLTISKVDVVSVNVHTSSGMPIQGVRYPNEGTVPHTSEGEIRRAADFFRQEYSPEEHIEEPGEVLIYTNSDGVRFELQVLATLGNTYGQLIDLLEYMADWTGRTQQFFRVRAGISPDHAPFAVFQLSSQSRIEPIISFARNSTGIQKTNVTNSDLPQLPASSLPPTA